MNVKTESLDMLQGGAALIRTGQANLTASNAGVLINGGAVKMDQSAARVLVSGGEVSMDQSGSVLMIANSVRTQNSGTVFLIARNVEGDVNPSFGPRESMMFGAVAGLVIGVLMLLGGFFKRLRRWGNQPAHFIPG
jgi:hypothetical protein